MILITTNAPVGGASAFSSRLAAEELIGNVLDTRSVDIERYLARSNRPLNSERPLDLEIGANTGRWVPNGGSSSQSVTAVRVIIRPDTSVSSGYSIVTAFPIHSSIIMF